MYHRDKEGCGESPYREIEDLICNHKLILTVHQGSVQKYDGLIAQIIEQYGCDDYTDNFIPLSVLLGC